MRLASCQPTRYTQKTITIEDEENQLGQIAKEASDGYIVESKCMHFT